jgi:hypothetical protein
MPDLSKSHEASCSDCRLLMCSWSGIRGVFDEKGCQERVEYVEAKFEDHAGLAGRAKHYCC